MRVFLKWGSRFSNCSWHMRVDQLLCWVAVHIPAGWCLPDDVKWGKKEICGPFPSMQANGWNCFGFFSKKDSFDQNFLVENVFYNYGKTGCLVNSKSIPRMKVSRAFQRSDNALFLQVLNRLVVPNFEFWWCPNPSACPTTMSFRFLFSLEFLMIFPRFPKLNWELIWSTSTISGIREDGW